MTSLSSISYSPTANDPSLSGTTDSSGGVQSGLEMMENLNSQLQQMVKQLMQTAQQQQQGSGGDTGGDSSSSGGSQQLPQMQTDPSMMASAAGAGDATGTGAASTLGGSTASSSADDAKYSALDQYSQTNDQSDLSKWSDLASPDQGASLERPLAAMQILSGKTDASGNPPSAAEKQAAMQFVNDNPSLKSALQNTGALKSDGTIDTKKMDSFMGQVSKNLDQADSDIKDYMKKHPDADADSVNVERSAGLMKAYNAIAGESEGHQSHGKNSNNYTSGGKNGGGLTTQKQVEDLEKNAGFSSALKSAASAFGSDGGFDDLDRSGDDKATSKRDKIFSTSNLDHFLSSDAPTTQAGSQQFLQDASLENITGNTDISNLNGDVIQNPQNYSPQQKAAVMVKLMETLVDVQAGGSDKLKNVDKTVAALQTDIQKLASDPDTAAYLQKTVPPEMQQMSGQFEGAGGVTSAGSGDSGSDGTSGATGSGQNAGQTIDDVHRGLSDAKTVAQSLGDLAKGEGAMGLSGDAAGAEGAAAAAGGAEGGAEGAAAGAEAAEGAAAGVEGGAAAGEGVLGAVGGAMAAAAPVMAVGAAVVGIAGIIFAIVEAVKKKENQKKFGDNVDPTLKQFGIPLPS